MSTVAPLIVRTPAPHPSALLGELPDGAATPVYHTTLGQLYQGDCVPWLKALPDGSIDMVFADPPFNLNKNYGPGVSDKMNEGRYLAWSTEWIDECVRVLKPGGALLLFNLPKWCVEYGAHLNRQGMMFRHWIACRMPKSLPIPKRMSPAHYGLLYYTKGAPAKFHTVRVPIQTCRHCGGEVRDYGGHRDKLNPAGLNLMDVFDASEEVWEDAPDPLPPGEGWTRASDVWDDVPPVRHSRYKHREANALAPIMLERVIAMTTDADDVVLDPFAGTGTTAYAAEYLGRRWLSIELGDVAPAINRLTDHANGEHPRWESARGHSRLAGKTLDREKRRRRAAEADSEPELPLGNISPGKARPK